MTKQKIIFGLLLVFMISGFITCTIDKTPIGIEEEKECWNNKITIRDYEYLKNRYFFVDTFYVNYFEQGWTDDLSNWVYTESRLIRELEVYISTTYSNEDIIEGLAVLDPHEFNNIAPSVFDTIIPVPGKVERANFIKLEEIVDYKYDYARGFLWTNHQIEDHEVLAVSFRTDIDTMGTFFQEFAHSTKLPVFRLIKSKSMGPWHFEVWPLMMKNVYSLVDSMINHDCFNIQIEYNLNGEHQTIQPVDPKKSYMNLMGLDRNDENGLSVEGGDGKIDDNSLLTNRFDGTLMFPGLYPFNPLPQSRFQIVNKADLYETTNNIDLQAGHKYDIIVTSKVEK